MKKVINVCSLLYLQLTLKYLLPRLECLNQRNIFWLYLFCMCFRVAKNLPSVVWIYFSKLIIWQIFVRKVISGQHNSCSDLNTSCFTSSKGFFCPSETPSIWGRLSISNPQIFNADDKYWNSKYWKYLSSLLSILNNKKILNINIWLCFRNTLKVNTCTSTYIVILNAIVDSILWYISILLLEKAYKTLIIIQKWKLYMMGKTKRFWNANEFKYM